MTICLAAACFIGKTLITHALEGQLIDVLGMQPSGDGESSLELEIAEFAGISDEYREACRGFYAEKQSNNPAASSAESEKRFRHIYETTASGEEKIRCAYFLACTAFLKRDFGKSYQYCSIVLSLSSSLYPDNEDAVLARSLAQKAYTGDVNTGQLCAILAARKQDETALMAIESQGWFLHRRFDPDKNKPEEK